MTRLFCFLFVFLSSAVLADVAKEMHIEGYTDSQNNQVQLIMAPNSQPAKTVKSSMSPKAIQASWQNYFTRLQTCEPSVNPLKEINPELAGAYGESVTNTIKGMANGKCQLISLYPKKDAPANTPIKGQECFLTNDTIKSLITLYGSLLEGEEVKNTMNDPLTKGLMEECNAFLVIQGKMVRVESPPTQ